VATHELGSSRSGICENTKIDGDVLVGRASETELQPPSMFMNDIDVFTLFHAGNRGGKIPSVVSYV
jgi:hypothetical protein